jgi:hypothetical protein
MMHEFYAWKRWGAYRTGRMIFKKNRKDEKEHKTISNSNVVLY